MRNGLLVYNSAWHIARVWFHHVGRLHYLTFWLVEGNHHYKLLHILRRLPRVIVSCPPPIDRILEVPRVGIGRGQRSYLQSKNSPGAHTRLSREEL
jgi:hypothetical protein